MVCRKAASIAQRNLSGLLPCNGTVNRLVSPSSRSGIHNEAKECRDPEDLDTLFLISTVLFPVQDQAVQVLLSPIPTIKCDDFCCVSLPCMV